MKLQQGQVWKCGEEYVRIVHLERLAVGYKSATNLQFTGGNHQHTSKKDFCRLLKGATLLAPKTAQTQQPEDKQNQNCLSKTSPEPNPRS